MMLQTGVQTKNVVEDRNPEEGFKMLSRAGFSCADFSLNSYLVNRDIYQSKLSPFFDSTVSELERFFQPHREGARVGGITINQMHMPYPLYVPKGKQDINEYLREQVAPKSMAVCHFFGCSYMAIHGFKLATFLGSEEAEWAHTEQLIHFLAPMAKEMGITLCVENLYDSVGGHLVEGPCCNVRKMVDRIDRINDRYHEEILGFCFDTGHANLVGLDFERFLTALDHRLKVLHIHDNDGISDLHQIPFTFTRTRENHSSTDWEGFVRGLKTIGFNGVLSFETAPVLTSFPEKMKEDVLVLLAGTGKYFANTILGQKSWVNSA